jgi:hypothetical protein
VVVDDFDTVGTSCRADEVDATLPIDADVATCGSTGRGHRRHNFTIRGAGQTT